jgi:uncharacterized protein YjeT (DUF2065 family)
MLGYGHSTDFSPGILDFGGFPHLASQFVDRLDCRYRKESVRGLLEKSNRVLRVSGIVMATFGGVLTWQTFVV